MTVPQGEASPQRGRWGIVECATAMLCTVLLITLLPKVLSSALIADPHLGLVLGYAVVWIPLLAAVGYACFVRGSGSLSRDIGLRFTFLDVLFGVSVGILARVVARIIELTVANGQSSGAGASFGEVVHDGWWLFGLLLAPVLFAPVIEELFFRGLLQKATYRAAAARASTRAATIASVLASAVLFAILHLTQTTTPTGALVLGLSTFVFGLAAATMTALTGRIGGAIVAHVVFNGWLVVPTLL